MAKTVVFLFHDDDPSLRWGSQLAAGVSGVEDSDVEVFCFGPAQAALTASEHDSPTRAEYRQRLDGLAKAGVPVGVCASAATGAGVEAELSSRGYQLVSPRERVLEYTAAGAVVLTF